MNQITHWLDASNIYGSSEHETEMLRQGTLGLLKTTIKPGTRGHHHHQTLPKCERFRNLRDSPGMCEGCGQCYLAGTVI